MDSCARCGGELLSGHVCNGAMQIAHEENMERAGRAQVELGVRALLRELGRFPSEDERWRANTFGQVLDRPWVTPLLLLAQLTGVRVKP